MSPVRARPPHICPAPPRYGTSTSLTSRPCATSWPPSTTRSTPLINNAGVANVPLGRTRDANSETHLRHQSPGALRLTNLLLPQITDRVVTIASNAHKSASLDLSDPNWERRPYRSAAAYGQSKLANLLFTWNCNGV